MHKLISFLVCNNLGYNDHVSRIIVHLHLREFFFEKMAVRNQPIDKRKRKHSISNFTFYLTHPVTINTSTVMYITHLVPAGNMEYVKYKATTKSVFIML